MEDSMAGEIHMNQFGFLKGRSTKQCFLELVRCMVEMGLMQETSFTVLWDFSAAFPSINREWIWRSCDDLSTVLQHADDLDLVDALFKLVSLALSLQIKTSKICVLVHHPHSTNTLCELLSRVLCECYPGLKADAVGEHVTHLGHEVGSGADDRALTSRACSRPRRELRKAARSR
eukprot:2863111-Amphidinium_carterae.2